MPKQVDYPRASLKNCLGVSEAVNELGGTCSFEMAAEKLGKAATSGAFKALVGSTVKYGLITNKKGQLAISGLSRDYVLAYSKEEATKVLQRAFLMVPLFSAICERFNGKPLPVSHFEKLLIKEFEVPDNLASRVSKYFLEGAKQCNLLGADNIITKSTNGADEIIDNTNDNGRTENSAPDGSNTATIDSDQDSLTTEVLPASERDKFTIRINGPGMDSLIAINEAEDLYIVQAMLKKVEKSIKEESKTADED